MNANRWNLLHIMNANSWPLLLTLTTLVALAAGTLGFHLLDPGPGWQGWTTAFYKAVQLFSLNSGVVEGKPTPALIEISRWLALGSLVGAIWATVRALLGNLRSSLQLTVMNGHLIVCGAGKRGAFIAKAEKKRGTRVVVIESDENNAAVGELRKEGVLIVSGNALDATVLQRAGIGRAGRLVAMTGSDEKNLRLCTEVHNDLKSKCTPGSDEKNLRLCTEVHNDLNSECTPGSDEKKLRLRMVAGIESWALRSYYRDRLPSIISLESYLSRAARHLMCDLGKLAAADAKMRARGVRILIEGSGEALQEMVRAAGTLLQVSADKQPVIHVASALDADKDSFTKRFPAVDLAVEIHWHEEGGNEVFPEGESEPDFAVFAYSEDLQSFEAADQFSTRHDLAPDRIFACFHGEELLPQKTDQVGGKPPFEGLDLLSHGLVTKNPLESPLEEAAQKCHEEYCRREREAGNLNPKAWKDLPEGLKESNRLAAMHNEIKKRAWESRGEVSEKAMLDHLAQCEHRRWMAEKVMDGYRFGERKDDIKRTHNLLKPFEKLEESVQTIDYDIFRWCLGLPEE
jgi:hypothetical protein